MGSFAAFTSALGAGLVLYASYKILDTAWLYARPSSLDRYRYADGAGRRAWALVTGASDGIGKCLALELAGRGFNVVLHGRNPAKLAAVGAALRAAHPGAEVRAVVADASRCHRAADVDFDRLRDELAGLHLTVLVNCAGAGPTPSFGALEAYGRDEILDTLHLNAVFPALLTATLLPTLKGRRRDDSGGRRSRSRSRSGPALIINIGSVTDDGFPLVSFYSAGKAATHALHKALAREAALDDGDGGGGGQLEVISHRISAVTGVSHTRAAPTLLRPDARTVARAVLARTGCGRASVVPYWPHALLQGLLAVLPRRLADRLVNGAMRACKREQDDEAAEKKGS